MNLADLAQATTLAKRRDEVKNWLRYASGYSEMTIAPLADRAQSIRVFRKAILPVLEKEISDIEEKLAKLGITTETTT